MRDPERPRPPRRTRRWPAIVAICIGIALIGVFGTRAWQQYQIQQRVERGEVRIESLRGWMTLAYIGRVYGVPEADLRRGLGLPMTGHAERSLRAWFDTVWIDPKAGRRTLEALILARPPSVSESAEVSETIDALLTGLLNYGTTLLFLVLFFAAVGVPLPATMLVIAAGAFASQGFLSAGGATIAAFVGSVVGDQCSYLLGRFAAKRLPATLRDSPTGVRAALSFARWGGWSVFLSRFLFTPIALPVNLLAGSTRYAWARFSTASVAGEATWIILFGSLGYLFADRWETLSQAVGDGLGLVTGAALVAIGIGLLSVRRFRRRRGHESAPLQTPEP